MAMRHKERRAESRCRYLVREIASQKGWNVKHPQRGGNFLEEQEIGDFFPDSGLEKTRPDFLVCKDHRPLLIVEAKNDIRKIDTALAEAVEYADAVTLHGVYSVRIAVGAAGEEDHGYLFKTAVFNGTAWLPLMSHGFELTSFPSVDEVEAALLNDHNSIEVTLPRVSDYIETALGLSAILRSAKIEVSARAKVLGAVITALYQGEIEIGDGKELTSINALVEEAIYATSHFKDEKKRQLIEALHLQDADYARLAPKMGQIVFILKTLNIKSLLRTDTDFLGLLYEAFIRYGYDNNPLGIVFTPRHITRFCADLIDVTAEDRVIDIACGSGGFLVASYDRMIRTSEQLGVPHSIIRESIYGFDTNPTVWALAALNMFFRGDGKSHIENTSCFDEKSREQVKGRFTKALLNPPFSQEDEPERDFISTAMEALQTRKLLAAVVKSGIFADDENALWRDSFLKRHSILGMISLPGDLFYPTAVDTTIVIAQAHRPQDANDDVFMAKIWNDGYKKSKGKRIDAPGSQLGEVLDAFQRFQEHLEPRSDLVTLIKAKFLMAPGAEFCPERYLPQPRVPLEEQRRYQDQIVKAILTASVCLEDIAEEVLDGFPCWKDLPRLPYGRKIKLGDLFYIQGGRSTGEKSYLSGSCPYVSSGDPQNSIIRLVQEVSDEVFPDGAITVTCFGQACIQPWRFMARGNGGSAVRVLSPKYEMTFSELVWFCAQINMQRWRFFYGRMAIQKRLKDLVLETPPGPISDTGASIHEKVRDLSKKVRDLMES